MQFSQCKCGHRVPFYVFSTSEIPPSLRICGSPRFVQACVIEKKLDQDTRENGANTISRMLPFLEQRLYSQLTTKMLALHCNAVFGISIEMEVGGTLLAGVITGTAVNIPGLTKMHSIETDGPFSHGCMEKGYVQINVRMITTRKIRRMKPFLLTSH